MRQKLEAWLNSCWYPPRYNDSAIAKRGGWMLRGLKPLAYIYGQVIAVRRHRTRRSFTSDSPVGAIPTVVVGNLTVGGSGKTPLVAALVQHFQRKGWRPGIVSRGYGGTAPRYPKAVSAYSQPTLCGDEAVDLAQITGAPVVVSRNRREAREWLRELFHCRSAISDDGLQHYAMQRQLELVVVNARRGFGNQQLLPCGPLREPMERLCEVDLVIVMGEASLGDQLAPMVEQLQQLVAAHAPDTPVISCVLRIKGLVSLSTGERVAADQAKTLFERHKRWVAVSGISHPESFHGDLRSVDAEFDVAVFADHADYTVEDLAAFGDSALVTTSKDAVKIRALQAHDAQLKERDIWVLERSLCFDAQAQQRLNTLVDALMTA